MRDFFETQKHIIIVLIVIIAITIISGYFSSFYPSYDTTNEPSLLNEPSSSEPSSIEENDSPLHEVPKERSTSNEGVKANFEIEQLPQPQEESKVPTISAKLVISGEAYMLSLPEQSFVYDLMSKAREVYGISFGGKEYAGIGFFVEEIEGIKNNANGNDKYWIYSINGKKASVGISTYIVQPGDSISWNYEEEME